MSDVPSGQKLVRILLEDIDVGQDFVRVKFRCESPVGEQGEHLLSRGGHLNRGVTEEGQKRNGGVGEVDEW